MEEINYDQPNDSDTKWCAENRRLTAGKSEGYTSRCLLDYGFVKKSL